MCQETFKQTIVSYLKEKGASPLSKLGNDCKKPAEIKYVCGILIREVAQSLNGAGPNSRRLLRETPTLSKLRASMSN